MPSHILIAHDLRDTADMALCRATQLAKQFNAKLTILHVLDPSKSSQEHEQAKQALDRSLTQYAPAGSQLLIRTGIKPSEVVLQQLNELGCDLLVLGGHHQRHDFFSGTSLDRIARNCPVPLLLVARNDFKPYQRALAAIDFSLCACSALGQGLPPAAGNGRTARPARLRARQGHTQAGRSATEHAKSPNQPAAGR